MAGVALAFVVVGSAIGMLASIVLLYGVLGVLRDVRDALRVLIVQTNGLEAKLVPLVEGARDSADATVEQFEKLHKTMAEAEVADSEKQRRKSPLESVSPLGRIHQMRAAFAEFEQASLDGVTKNA